MTEIITLGSLNIDYVAQVPHLPVKGETIQATDFSIFPGGKGANQAVAAARMGGEVAMVGCIGKDKDGNYFKEVLAREGIDLTGLKESEGSRTGLAMIGLDTEGNNSIITYPGANEDLNRKDILALQEIFAQARITNLHWDVGKQVGEKFIELAHENEVKVVLNLAPVRPISSEVLKLVDVLIINEVEAEMLTDIKVIDFKSARKSAEALKKRGLDKLVVTLGEKGIAIFSSEKEQLLPVNEVEVVDTTAAGDTFVGAFTYLYLNNSLIKAAELAGKAASLAVTKYGAITSIPTREEVAKEMS